MKILNHKNYGSIPHLLGSKLGTGDHYIHKGQHDICTIKTRDAYDNIIVTEKYDGSNVGVCKKNGKIFALIKRGYEAITSPFIQHHIFDQWVHQNEGMFNFLLGEGERIVGEWLLQAHGEKYEFTNNYTNRAPFVPFDYFMPDNTRLPFMDFNSKLRDYDFKALKIIHIGNAISIEGAFDSMLYKSNVFHDVICDNPKGIVYRVERKDSFDFAAKFVRNDFEVGKYLPEISGKDAIFNIDPKEFLK